MKQHPLIMAIQHRPLETAMRDFAALENPTPLQVQTHALDLVAKALDGSEVLVLCMLSEDDEHWLPVIANTPSGLSFAMAATSMAKALDVDRWAINAGFVDTVDRFSYVPLSSRELVMSQLAQGSDGVAFNQTLLEPDVSGLIEFSSVSFGIIMQFAQFLRDGTVMPEELLTLLALEEDRSECQSIARDFFLNSTNNLEQITVFELQSVAVDDVVFGMAGLENGRTAAHIFTTNATSVLWGFKYALQRVPGSSKQINVGFSVATHQLSDLIEAMAVSGRVDMTFMLDEKIMIEPSFAREIIKVRSGS